MHAGISRIWVIHDAMLPGNAYRHQELRGAAGGAKILSVRATAKVALLDVEGLREAMWGWDGSSGQAAYWLSEAEGNLPQTCRLSSGCDAVGGADGERRLNAPMDRPLADEAW